MNPVETDAGQAEIEQSAKAVAASKRIIIAIHGIGDQFQNATVKTVVSAVGKYLGYPAATPLGSFRTAGGTIRAFTLPTPPPSAQPLPSPLANTGFVEIYWANVPRAIRRRGYIIEESKAWARTLVERVRARYGVIAERKQARIRNPETSGHWGQPNRKAPRPPPQLNGTDFLAAADSIEEMIETIAVLGNLLWIAEKAGILRFDLDELLTTYLGTVQIVGDFVDYRNRIVDRFCAVLDAIEKEVTETPGDLSPPEIYIVAHSEGTVVAFMGLLEAMSDRKTLPPAWSEWVRGFMTIGSPIDKHLILWPDIWESVQTPHPNWAKPSRVSGRKKIQWRNYYDHGDPVGYELDTARGWLSDHGWREHVFDFWGCEDCSPPKPGKERNDDYGFARYLLPGAAHIGYWNDEVVFGHFLENVVYADEDLSPRRFAKPPKDIFLRSLACNVIPHLIVFGLIYLGTYLLYKALVDFLNDRTLGEQVSEAVRAALGQEAQPSVDAIAARDLLLFLPWNVFGISALLAGTTALARIPRLTRRGSWLGGAILTFIAGAALYFFCVTPEAHHRYSFCIFRREEVAALFGGLSSRLAERLAALFVVVLAGCFAALAAYGGRQRGKATTS